MKGISVSRKILEWMTPQRGNSIWIKYENFGINDRYKSYLCSAFVTIFVINIQKKLLGDRKIFSFEKMKHLIIANFFFLKNPTNAIILHDESLKVPQMGIRDWLDWNVGLASSMEETNCHQARQQSHYLLVIPKLKREKHYFFHNNLKKLFTFWVCLETKILKRSAWRYRRCVMKTSDTKTKKIYHRRRIFP